MRQLAEWFARLLPADASVLDVGTGDGRLARLVLDQRPDLKMRGVEVLPRTDCAIPAEKFDGLHLPFADGAFDAVTVSDVLHHAEQPVELLRDAARVSRSVIIIKDHLLTGFFAGPTLRLMDRVGNRRFGVPVPGVYWPEATWRHHIHELGLRVDQWHTSLGLYPWWLNWWFGRSLHLVAFLKKR